MCTASLNVEEQNLALPTWGMLALSTAHHMACHLGGHKSPSTLAHPGSSGQVLWGWGSPQGPGLPRQPPEEGFDGLQGHKVLHIPAQALTISSMTLLA